VIVQDWDPGHHAVRAAVRRGMSEATALLDRMGVRPDSGTLDVDPVSTL